MWQNFLKMATVSLVVCSLLICAVTPVRGQLTEGQQKFSVGDNVYFELDGRTSQGRVLGYNEEFRMYRVEYLEEVFNPEPKAVLDPPKKTARYIAGTDLSKSKPPLPKIDETKPASATKTPQAEINDQGDIVVPGQGGLKFAANGDIFSSDGKKLYDSATGKWAEGALVESSATQIGLPNVKVGSTIEQNVRIFKEVKSQGIGTVFEYSDWRILMSPYRGRIDDIVLSKPLGNASEFTTTDLYALVDQPESDIVALRRLHGESRKWIEVSADTHVVRQKGASAIIADYRPAAADLVDSDSLYMPDIAWHSTDGILRQEYRVSHSSGVLTKTLSLSTRAHRERTHGETDPVKMNRQDARLAWELGFTLTMLAANSENAQTAQKGWTRAKSLFERLRATEAARAADPSLAELSLPVDTGNATEDRIALIRFLDKASNSMLKSLGSDDQNPSEPAVTACFEMARRSFLLPIIISTDNPDEKSKFVAGYSKLCSQSNLPKSIWNPLLQKAQRGAEVNEVAAESKKVNEVATSYLDRLIAEAKTKVKPTEQ